MEPSESLLNSASLIAGIIESKAQELTEVDKKFLSKTIETLES